MMKKFLFLLLLSFVYVGSSQVSFQQGYIIDNTGKKVQCYIQNKDWKRNPTSVTYKTDKSSPEEILTINQIKEFKINDTDHFYKQHKITKQLVGPLFEEMQLSNSFVLLRVLVDGESSLYEIHNKGKYFFFYEKDDGLVFLDYKKTIDENNRVRENAPFKRQLFDNFKCDDFILEDYSNLRYNSTNLSDFFTDYNKCKGEEYTNLHDQRTKPKISLKLKGGLNINSNQINTNASSYVLSYSGPPPFSINPVEEEIVRTFGGEEDYGDNTNHLSFGMELEVRLPFDQNNWSVFLAPNYQNVSDMNSSSSFSESNVADFEIISNLSYSFFQIPIGLRRYFDINNKLEIYAHIAYTQNRVLSFDQSSQLIETPTSSTSYDLREVRSDRDSDANNSGGYIGIGLNLLGKYALEINYYSLNLSLDDANQIDMKGLAINVSYAIF
ncbi:hypothetical protein [Winogradskyella sp.]|uniref:hypothetical protein n=1 Tax=Winogradskyella sp. TaxID=1883156 RepID=UPI00260B43C0|nr:hypothetical protein [Winogradskyella sp.]